MDNVKVAQGPALPGFHGLELPIRGFGGARALRVVHPAGQRISPHRHDWPLLTIPALGGYDEELEEGSIAISGPAAVFHPAGRCHANCIHQRGMETISIEFDPAWLRTAELAEALHSSHFWKGGAVVLTARTLARQWHDPAADERQLQRATADFLIASLGRKDPVLPHWFEQAAGRVARDPPATAAELATGLRLHPRWFAHAYRSLAGEGLQDSVIRRRTEQAVHLLRTTSQSMAQVAVEAGFFDQSHMSRVVRRISGRTPKQIRSEGKVLALLVSCEEAQAVSGTRVPS